jgi:hypothetical protein
MSYRHKAGFMPWDRTGNRVLVKSSLGKNKPTNYNIPEDNFIYGKLTYQDNIKANDMIYNWNGHKRS